MIKVDAETARAELERFLELADTDTAPPDAKARDDFAQLSHVVVRAIMQGRITVDERGLPTVHPRTEGHHPVVFKEPTGATLVATDSKGADRDVAKTFAAMSDQTGTPIKHFSMMHGKDVTLCTAVFSLFLG